MQEGFEGKLEAPSQGVRPCQKAPNHSEPMVVPCSPGNFRRLCLCGVIIRGRSQETTRQKSRDNTLREEERHSSSSRKRQVATGPVLKRRKPPQGPS